MCVCVCVCVCVNTPHHLSVNAAVSDVNAAIGSGGLTGLLRALQAGDAHLSDVVPENLQWYMDMLSKAVEDKAEVRRRRGREGGRKGEIG